MLTSAGYFSGVPCPSESEGCNRPYCPFRHKRSSNNVASTSISAAFQSIDNTIEKIKADIRNKSSGILENAKGDGNSSLMYETYHPEPYDPTKDNFDLHLQEEPRSVLHCARGPLKSQLKKSSKNLYNTKSLGHPTTDMEYDPVVNYSTSGRSKSKQIYKLSNDDSGSSKETHWHKCISSEQEILDSERARPSPNKKSSNENDSVHDPDSCSQNEDSGEDEFVIDEGSSCPSNDAVAEIFGTNSSGDDKDVVVITSDISDDDTAAGKSDVIDLTGEEKLYDSSSTSKRLLGAEDTQKPKKKLKSKRKGSKLDEKECDSSTVSTKRKIDNPAKKRKVENENQQKQLTKSKKIRNSKEEGSLSKSTEVVPKSKKRKKVGPNDIDISKINKYIDKDEIKKLNEDLETADRYEECLKIFQEQSDELSLANDVNRKEQSTPVLTVSDSPQQDQPSVPTKKRIAHASASSSAGNLRRPSAPRKKLSTPAQMMMKRLDIVEEEEAARLASAESTKRVAHKISNKMASFREKSTSSRINIRQLESKTQSSTWYPKDTPEPTICGTAVKGERRVAHQSKDLLAMKSGSNIPPRPRIAIERHSKVPTNIRQRYLTTYIDECLRICGNDYDMAYAMALAEEEQCKKRSNSKNIYLSLAASGLKRLRDMPQMEKPKDTEEIVESQPKRRKVSNNLPHASKVKGVQSHDTLLDVNTKKCKGGYTIEKRKEKAQLTTSELYEKMCCYIMTHEQLNANGYPRPSDIPGVAEFRADPPLKAFNKSEKKICAHCGKEFFLRKNGQFFKVEECTYHWGRAYMTKVGRGWEKRYSCCQEREGVEGCTVGETHVHADNKLDRSGYVKTLSKSPPPDGNCGIFTLDCEMSYTTNGLELTRVSVLDHNCKLVYDSFVKPSGRVLDYNTRWSGITEDHLRHVKTTLRDVQAAFLTKFSSDTILMGHSLESDLVALRIIHETVIDTSIVFPHKRGPPYKRSLKNIASENIGLIIQTGASEGHDSAEDAAACMKLMMWRIEEDNKLLSKKLDRH